MMTRPRENNSPCMFECSIVVHFDLRIFLLFDDFFSIVRLFSVFFFLVLLICIKKNCDINKETLFKSSINTKTQISNNFSIAQLDNRLTELIAAVGEGLLVVVSVGAGGIDLLQASMNRDSEIVGAEDCETFRVVWICSPRHKLKIFILANLNTFTRVTIWSKVAQIQYIKVD
jgi:hypothetical protein